MVRCNCLQEEAAHLHVFYAVLDMKRGALVGLTTGLTTGLAIATATRL